VKTYSAFLFIGILLACTCLPVPGSAAGPNPDKMPAIDYTLTAFKDQGVWYFPCTAPVYLYRVPPHALTYAPPPACWPAGYPPATQQQLRVK
jgi:hypothetical protein